MIKAFFVTPGDKRPINTDFVDYGDLIGECELPELLQMGDRVIKELEFYEVTRRTYDADTHNFYLRLERLS